MLANLPADPLAQVPTGFAEPAPGWEGPAADLTKARRAVLELLSPSPASVDDLVRRCQFSPSAIMAVLLELELAGRVETLAGSRVALLPAGGANAGT